jgi:hypothetical protein
VTASPVSALASIIISGSDGRDVQNATLTVLPPLASFNLKRSTVTGGVSSVTGSDVEGAGTQLRGGHRTVEQQHVRSYCSVERNCSGRSDDGTFTVTTSKVPIPKTVTIGEPSV